MHQGHDVSDEHIVINGVAQCKTSQIVTQSRWQMLGREAGSASAQVRGGLRNIPRAIRPKRLQHPNRWSIRMEAKQMATCTSHELGHRSIRVCSGTGVVLEKSGEARPAGLGACRRSDIAPERRTAGRASDPQSIALTMTGMPSKCSRYD
eukprot:scaffold72403_cov21-Prasinocladus_malaysianus.AAC.1